MSGAFAHSGLQAPVIEDAFIQSGIVGDADSPGAVKTLSVKGRQSIGGNGKHSVEGRTRQRASFIIKISLNVLIPSAIAAVEQSYRSSCRACQGNGEVAYPGMSQVNLDI